MPNAVSITREYGPVSYGTYGEQGATTWLLTKQFDRTRSWSNSSYRTAALRAKRIMTSGFLPTQAYTDDLQQIVNSKSITISGLLYSDPRSTFLWRTIPSQSRMSCNVLDADVVSAKQSALDIIQGQLSGVGVSVPLTVAEAGKTADMIWKATQQLLLAYRHVRHGNYLAAARALGLKKTPARVGRWKTPDENWLEYRYGWRLVVFDVEAYMKQIYNMLTTKPIVYRVTTKVTRSGRYAGSWNDWVLYNPSGLDTVRYTCNRVETRDVEARAGYVYALECSALSTGQELGLLNLASVLWDLLPGSFLADWAVNISSVLEGLTAFQGKKFLDGWTCSSVHTKRSEWWTNVRKGDGIFRLDSGLVFTSGPIEERRFSRSVLTSFQPATLRLDFSASFKNAIDGLAIIKQVFGNRK